MNLIATILILGAVEILCLGWAGVISGSESPILLTQMLPFMMLDSATILVISRYPVFKLTRRLKICLYLSMLVHLFGAFCWVAYMPTLDLYDNLKDVIFYLELMAFTAYGISNGGRRLRTMAFSSSLDGLFRVSSSDGNHQARQARGGR